MPRPLATTPIVACRHLLRFLKYLRRKPEKLRLSIPLGDFDGDDAMFGIGVAANIETALLRLEYRVAKLDDSDISALTLALVWRFGG